MELSHYCIIRRDLPPGVQDAYLVHAAGESSPGNLPSGTRAVVLSVRDEKSLRRLAEKLSDVPHVAIVEDGVMYSIGIRPAAELGDIQEVTSNLSLSG